MSRSMTDEERGFLIELLRRYGDKAVPSGEYTSLLSKRTIGSVQGTLCILRKQMGFPKVRNFNAVFSPLKPSGVDILTEPSGVDILIELKKLFESFIQREATKIADELLQKKDELLQKKEEEIEELKTLLRKLKTIREAVESFHL